MNSCIQHNRWFRTGLAVIAGTVAACSDGRVHDPESSAAGSTVSKLAPGFPGAGLSGADQPMANGQLCDFGPSDFQMPKPEDITQCFFDKDGGQIPVATLEQVLECAEGLDVVHLRLTFNPDFVDNTFGAGSIGWPQKRGHRFSDLVGSDHAELLVRDGDDNIAAQFKLDYISEDDSAVSGYASMGVGKKNGAMIVGDPSWIVDYRTSLERNLNERGYSSYVVDSPDTDNAYTINPSTPNWDYRVVYEVWVDVDALGGNGFGGASIEYVHASPAKKDNDTIEVTPGECPPTYCVAPEGCAAQPPTSECVDSPDQSCVDGPPPVEEEDTPVCVPAPDAPCTDGESTNESSPPSSEFCVANPQDPSCLIE